MATFRGTANDYKGSRRGGRSLEKRNGLDNHLRFASRMSIDDILEDETWDDVDSYAPTYAAPSLGYDD